MAAPAAAAPAKKGKTPWTVIYPIYINSRKTVAEGRRIATNKAVDNPSSNEVAEVCKQLGLMAEHEEKAYPRDWLHPGRVRVRLFTDDGKPVVSDITNKTKLMLRVAAAIPKLPNRLAGNVPNTGGSSTSRKKNKKNK